MLFSCLPAEIYAAFIEQLDEPDVRPTLLALTRAIPRSPVPQFQLFRRIHITKADQLVPLYERLRLRKRDGECQEDVPCNWVQNFALETWTADAESVLNLLTLLQNLSTLTIWIGPKNFAPEHLEELFSVDRGGRCLQCVGTLRCLSLRFRPYVQKATYHQFLSGSYFDSSLEALSRWPLGRLSTLSVVQDPLTIESGTSEGSEASLPPAFSLGLPQRTLATGFAQPIVFFQLQSAFPGLLRSSYLRIPLQSLRLRFPLRNITQALTQAPVFHPPSYGASIPVGYKPSKKYFRCIANAHLSPTPFLKILDLSTCLISESNLPQILMNYPSLTHLILDGCNILRNSDIAVRDSSREWGNVAMSCAVAGIIKAKEKEKTVSEWLDIPRMKGRQGKQLDDKEPNRQNNLRARGRKGLATATISFRKEHTSSNSVSTGLSITEPRVHDTPKRVRILPPLPTLRHITANLYLPSSMISLETGTPPTDTLDPLLVDIQREWERGWADGLTQLFKVRERLYTSWRNNVVRVMRFATPDELLMLTSGSSEEIEQSLGTCKNYSSRSCSPAKLNPDFFEASDDESQGEVLIDPLIGLIEVVDKSDFDMDISEPCLQVSSVSIRKAPILCLAGVMSSSGSEQGSPIPVGGGSTGTLAVQGLHHTLGCAHEAIR